MPKILINEKTERFTSMPGRYGNYSVLITGYAGTPDPSKGEPITPDENDVYEFNSAGDFLATIGEAAVEKLGNDGKPVEYHYGNKMAYELLKMGYQVIYKVITSVNEMNNPTFWKIFRDKASYDFRFVSHGLLETCCDNNDHAKLYDRLVELTKDLKKLEEIVKRADPKGENGYFAKYTEGTLTTTDKEAINEVFVKVVADKTVDLDDDGKADGEGYEGFLDAEDVQYGSFATAVAADDGVQAQYNAVKADLEAHNEKVFTRANFNAINHEIAQLANYRADSTEEVPGRGDCIALIELDDDIYCEADPSARPEDLIKEGISMMSNEIGDAGKYCVMTVPSVVYKSLGKLPGAFHYLACFMSSLRSGFAEWYAVAGYTRGVSSYAIDHTSVKLGEIAINALEPRSGDSSMFACNVIANFRGSYYLWGNRTAAPLGQELTADHFLNIRQLCATIKKQLYVACRRFTFDPNSDTLWINFVNAITPTLDAMKADQGISDYKIVKEYTPLKATLKARIRIIPIEAVEDFDITVSLEDSFGGVSVTAEG